MGFLPVFGHPFSSIWAPCWSPWGSLCPSFEGPILDPFLEPIFHGFGTKMAPQKFRWSSLKWGWKTTWDKIGSPSHPRSPLGLPLASLWPPFGLPFSSFGSPLASPFAPLTSLWSPFGLGTPVEYTLLSGSHLTKATCGLCRRHMIYIYPHVACWPTSVFDSSPLHLL